VSFPTRREVTGGGGRAGQTRQTRSLPGVRAGIRGINAARAIFGQRRKDKRRASRQRRPERPKPGVATPIEIVIEVPRSRPPRNAPGRGVKKRPTVTKPLPPDINIPKPEEPSVSIHKQLLGIARERILNAARGRSSTAPPGGFQQAGMIAIPPPVIARGGQIARTVFGRVGTAIGIGAGLATAGGFFARNEDGSCPVGTHPIKQDGVGGPKGSYCVRNRRMNVGNARAARRSVRRLKGARKLLKDIERMMPTKTTRRRAPVHHDHHGHHDHH